MPTMRSKTLEAGGLEGGDMSQKETFGSNVGEGIGCLFIALALIILFNGSAFFHLIETLLTK